MLDSRPNHNWIPVASLILAATLWGLFWYPLRLLADAGLHGLWATLLIYCGTIPVLLYLVYGRLKEVLLAPRVLLVIGLASGWCNAAFILAVIEGNVLRVLLLFYLSPVWTVMLGYLFLKEQPDRQGLLVIVFALIGAVVMLWDPSVGLPIPHDQADWLALSSGFAFAIINVCVRQAQQVSVAVKTAAAWLGTIIVSFLLILLVGVSLAGSDTSSIYLALIYGLVVMVIMTLSVQYGVTHMPVYRSAIILLFELVVGAVSAWLLTHEKILLQEWIGGGLVVFAAYLSARTEVMTEESNQHA